MGPAELSRRHAWALAIAATLTMTVSYIDRQTLAVLAPRVTEALDISEQGYAWLANAFSIAYLVGAPLAGRWIDRVGARRGLLAAVLLWSIVAGLHALVPSFAVLFALRIALGLAESPSFPGAGQTLQRVLPPADRARGFGLLFTGSSIGALIAAPLATSIEHAHGFRIAFLVSALVGVAWIPLWLAVANRPPARAVLDRTPVAAAGAPAGSALGLVRHPAVLRAIVTIFAAGPVVAFVMLWGSKYLVRDHGVAQHEVARYLWVPLIGFDVGSILFGHLASRRAARTADGTPARGLFAVAAALASGAALTPLASDPAGAMTIAAIALAGAGGIYAIATSDVLARVPPERVSTVGGLIAAAQSLSLIVANPLIGASVERSQSYTGSLIGLGLWVLPGCAVWLAWRPPPAIR